MSTSLVMMHAMSDAILGHFWIRATNKYVQFEKKFTVKCLILYTNRYRFNVTTFYEEAKFLSRNLVNCHSDFDVLMVPIHQRVYLVLLILVILSSAIEWKCGVRSDTFLNYVQNLC